MNDNREQDQKGAKTPGPEERPDLYDGYDGADRPEGWENPVKAPERIEKLIAERAKKADAK